MSKRGNHGGKAEHREKKREIIDLTSRRELKKADENLSDIMDLVQQAEIDGKSNPLDKWYCDQCQVAVNDKERCKHCGKTEKDLK